MRTERVALVTVGAASRVVDCLGRGGLVAVPTETVYGLAADATNGTAVAGIFEAKGRPQFNPLICHVCDIAMAASFAMFDDLARQLAERFWPGPLTLVLPLREGHRIHPLTLAGLPTVAVRMPQGPIGQIIRDFGHPLAAPSANRSGRVSPTTAEHVLKTLDGRIDLVADGGPTSEGLESTIVRPAGGEILLLRPGPITSAELQAATGLSVRRPEAGAPVEAPGQLLSHYAPHGQVRLDAERPEPGEYWIGFGVDPLDALSVAAGTANLSPIGDLREAAANLFAALSAFDRPDIARIAVASIPREGLGEAINDRLRRAAADR